MCNNENQTHEMQGFDPAVLFKYGFDLGSADLVVGGSFRHVVGRVTVFLLTMLRRKEGGAVFTGATILLPPPQATLITEQKVFSALLDALSDFRGTPADDEEIAILHRIVRVVHSPSLIASDLISTVEGMRQHSLVAVCEASLYRDISLTLPVKFGVTVTQLPEDRWAPHVTSLCEKLVPTVKRFDGYVFVHVQESPVQKTENMELILSVDDCYVLQVSHEGDLESLVAGRTDAWTNMVLTGRLAEVAAELDELDISEGSRLHVLAQLTNRTGSNDELLTLILKLQPHLDSLPAKVSIQVARFAAKTGDMGLANELLPDSADDIVEQAWLEEGLEIATQLKDNERIAKFDARLAELFPGTERLRENRDRRLLMNCQESQSSELQLFTTAGFTAQHVELQKRLFDDSPNYVTAIERAKQWGGGVVRACDCLLCGSCEKRWQIQGCSGCREYSDAVACLWPPSHSNCALLDSFDDAPRAGAKRCTRLLQGTFPGGVRLLITALRRQRNQVESDGSPVG